MAIDLELSLARLADSARRPHAPPDLAVRLRLFAALLRDAPEGTSGPRLLWRKPDKGVSVLAIDRRLVIGRDTACEVVLAAARISRRHCAVWIENGGAQIEDLQSANGTVVNGARLARGALHDGDVIEVGGVGVAFIL